MEETNLLEVKHLRTTFRSAKQSFHAVDDISFEVRRGETLGIVGESGCGKSVTSLSIMGLIKPPGKISGGHILYQGKDLTALSKRAMRTIRGKQIAMIFQEPMTSLNPVYTIGNQIEEALHIHTKAKRGEIRTRVVELLKLVGIPRAQEIVNEYPHQLSGGMRQRVMIAMAIACQPDLIIADEPTTALDVTIQAQILELLKDLQRQQNNAMILITHDLGVISEMCDRVVVMYAGKIVESAPVREILDHPRHPYTRGLLSSLPKKGQRVERLPSIPGQVPPPTAWGSGCRFADRCPHAFAKCRAELPVLVEDQNGHQTACWLVEEGGESFDVPNRARHA